MDGELEQGLDDFHAEATPEPGLEESSKGSVGRFFLDLLETLVLSVLLFVGINAVSARIRVDGSSMVPTLQSGEFVIVNRLAYRFGEPNYSDVVVFRFPRDPEQEYIKRVIALPGDTVHVQNRRVFVNGHEIHEPYINAAPLYSGEWHIPEGQVFVLGDNRNNSSDSHNWGPVPLEDIIGKAIFVYWPPSDWGVVASPEVGAAAYP